MKIKLTEAAVAKLATDKVQDYVWDTEVVGFGVIVSRTGTKTFVARGRDQAGIRSKQALGRFGDGGLTVAAARAKARKWIGDLGVGAVVKARDAAAGPTLRDALEHHVGKMEAGENRRRKVCSKRSIDTLRGGIELHFKDWLDEPLVRLDADAIEGVLRRVLKSTERRTGSSDKNPPGRALANRLLSNLGAVWRSWHRRHGLPVANPCERLLPGALAPRDTRVGNDELAGWHTKVLALENPVRRDMHLLSMFSGVRSDGLRHLRWADVDFDDELIHVERAKGDKPYTVPMTGALREILERRQRENVALLPKCEGWVFPSADSAEGCVAEVKERERETDDDGDVHHVNYLPGPHVNRRTYNSIAIEIGVPKEVRERLLNHEQHGVNVKHYGRPQDWSHTREWADKIEAAIWQRIRGEYAEAKAKRRRDKMRAV